MSAKSKVRDGAAPFKYLFLGACERPRLLPALDHGDQFLQVQERHLPRSLRAAQALNLLGYKAVFQNRPFPRYFLNSLEVTVFSLAIILLLGSLAAYGCVRWRSRYSRWIYLFFVAGLTVPIKIGSVNLLQIMIKLGLLDRTISVIPVYVAMGLPIAVFTLYEFIKGIPAELTEASLSSTAPDRSGSIRRSSCRSSAPPWRRWPSSTSCPSGTTSGFPDLHQERFATDPHPRRHQALRRVSDRLVEDPGRPLAELRPCHHPLPHDGEAVHQAGSPRAR